MCQLITITSRQEVLSIEYKLINDIRQKPLLTNQACNFICKHILCAANLQISANIWDRFAKHF